MVGTKYKNYTLHFSLMEGIAIHEMEEQHVYVKNIQRQRSRKISREKLIATIGREKMHEKIGQCLLAKVA